MKYIKQTSLSLILLVFLLTPVSSQDNRTLDTKVADLLVQVPADNQQDLDEQMILLLEMEDAGLQKVLEMIIPPGTGDDTNPRVAVESLSRFLSQKGKEKEKNRWEALLLKEIEKRDDPDVKSFLMSQLNYMGGDASLKVLTKYLTDTRLHDPAIRVMRDANPSVAASTFVDYLDKTSGNVQIALVNAIGETGIRDHAAAIGSLAGSGNNELQRSVLASLAKLGHPDSYKILMDAAKTTSYMPESTNATGSLLTYAQTLSENGNHNLSLKICKVLEKKCKDPEQIHFKTKALLTAAGNDNIDNSVSLLVDALKSKNKSYRMAAIDYAAKHNSPVAPWIKTLQTTKSTEVRSEVLYLFGLLAESETGEIVKGYMNDADATLRQQAVKSFTLIQQEEAVKEIVKYTLTFPASPDTKTARAALLQSVGKDDVQLLADQLENAPDGAKVVFLEVIAVRGKSDYFTVLFDQVESEGEVRRSALENLYYVASPEHLNRLLLLYDQLEKEEERLQIEKAIVVAVNRSPDRPAAIRTILSFASEKSSIRNFIGVLGSVGGEEAMSSVYSVYQSGDPEAQEEALGALTRSNDIAAIKALFEICSGNHSIPDKNAAFNSYVQIVTRSTETDDQKLLLLRKVTPYASDIAALKQIIGALGNVKTYLSFVVLDKYLDNNELQSEAANALVRVVLPSDGLENGLEGKVVNETLIRAREIVTGPDSEYIKIDIDNYLKEMTDQVGFVSMFNGRDLSGWQGLATDPVKKIKLSPEELKKLQEEADQKLLENWSVKDNCIVFNGHGANLCSIKEYGSFEMIVDWRITKKGDSGIYLRGSPQVQIWDISRVESGAQVGSGGLYNNQKHESKPLLVADNPVGEWNTFHITMIDERVTVTLNGKLVVDNVVMENYWDRGIPIFPTGSIELQAHGTDLAFRDIYVKELEPAMNVLSDAEKADGYVTLFNGKDLSGWTGENHSYAAENGTIVIRPRKGGGNLYTEKEYSDFIYRFEFKLTPGANNGLGIRTPLNVNAAYEGYELQILDNTAPVYNNLEPYQYHGSVYGIIPAKRGYLKPVGEWNSQEVIIKGDDIKITLNGNIIVEANIKEATKNGPADGKEHPGLKRTNGHIGFLGHGSLLWFRNIRIKEL
ncbi:MAG: family 16 glycoside hydrolase [Bacteroidota bacterium]